MPTIRHTQLRREPEPGQIQQIDDDPNKTTSADEVAIDSLLDGLDVSGGSVKVYRREPLGTKFGYVMSFPVEDFSLESLKLKSGGGDYKLAIYNSAEKKVRQVQFSIDSRVIGLLDPQRITAAPAATGNGGMDMFQMLLQQSQAAAAQQQQVFMQMMQMQQTNAQQMTQVLVAAMSGGKTPVSATGEPASQLLASMMPLLLANAKGSTSDLGAQLQHLKALKELAGPAGAEEKEEKEDGILSKVLEYGGPVLSAFLASRQQPQMPMQQAQVITHPMQQAQAAPVQPAQPAAQESPQAVAIPPEYQQLVAMLQGFTPLLVNAARQNSDVLTYQAMVDDVLDDAAYEMLQKVLAHDNWVAALFNNDAGVRAHLPWFESLRDTLLNPDAYDESPDPITAAETAASSPTLNGASKIPGATGGIPSAKQTILVP